MAPWDYVFQAAGKDKIYWDRHVRDPALIFLARGGNPKGRPQQHIESGEPDSARPSKKSRRTANKNDKINSLEQTISALKTGQNVRGSSGSSGANNTPKSKKPPRSKDSKGRYITDDDGAEICFNYQQGKCSQSGICRGDPPRSHVYQKCLGKHPTGSPECKQK